MRTFASAVLPLAQIVVSAFFALLAAVAAARAPRSGTAGRWVAAAFGAMALGLLGTWLPTALGADFPAWLNVGLVAIALILAFPYLLLRFTASFDPLPRSLELAAAAGTAVVAFALVGAYAAPAGPFGQGWDRVLAAVVAGYWVPLSLVTVWRMWRAGRSQPTVARRRMRLMSAATASLAVALLLAVQLGGDSAVPALLAHAAALGSAAVFGLGFAPPRPVRLSWRQAEEEYLRKGTIAVLGATTAEEVADELLPPTIRVVGGSGAALLDPDGNVIAVRGQAAQDLRPGDQSGPDCGGQAREVVSLGHGHGELVVWTSRYTPFFGREEVALLQAMGAVAGLALERCQLLREERAQREAVEEAQRRAEQASEEANQANTAKTAFLARMSHELRTPLNAILGFGQLLETSTLDDDDREGVQYILKAGRHLLELINDVLDLSRIEAGTLTVSPEPVHAAELIDDAVTMIQPLAERRSIRLDVNADGGCQAHVLTDRHRCRQVLLNLLSNAVKYNYDGGDVTVRCRQVDPATLRVSVRDSGPGIDPGRIEQLFEPFERLGAETSGIEGTGLGLALSKQLIERLGGTIGVEASPGQGATFWIDLAVTEPPPDAPPPPKPVEARPHAGEHRLLLVEDNLANLRVVDAMLRQRPGITVLPAMQGGLAIELAHEHRPDVIVLDLHLPDLPGREVLHRLRADPRTRDIPIVVASADATPGRVRQLREEGAFEYLTKPLDLHHFLEVVDAALASRQPATGPGA